MGCCSFLQRMHISELGLTDLSTFLDRSGTESELGEGLQQATCFTSPSSYGNGFFRAVSIAVYVKGWPLAPASPPTLLSFLVWQWRAQPMLCPRARLMLCAPRGSSPPPPLPSTCPPGMPGTILEPYRAAKGGQAGLNHMPLWAVRHLFTFFCLPQELPPLQW